MSYDPTRGNENVADVVGIEPYASTERIRELLQQFIVWLGQREPVAPGDPFTKFATRGFLVATGLLTDKQILGDDDAGDDGTGEDPTDEIDDPKVYAYARDFLPDATSPCASLAVVAMGSGMPDVQMMAFDSATNEAAQTQLILPPEWPGKSFQVRIYWSHPLATSWGVAWEVQAYSCTNDDPMAVAFVGGVIATDTGGTTNDLYVSASNVVTIEADNTMPGDLVFIKLIRRTDLADDTLNADAYFHAIEFMVGETPADFPPIVDTQLVWNSADKHADIALSNGDLTAAHSVAAFRTVRGDISKSTGKWYFECTINTLVSFGIVGVSNSTEALTNFVGGSANSWGAGNATSPNSYAGGSSTSIAVLTWVSGDVIQIAWDADAGKLWFGRNDVWAGVSGVDAGFGNGIGDPASGANARYTSVTGTLYPACSPGNGGQITINSTLTYAPPAGFSAWDV